MKLKKIFYLLKIFLYANWFEIKVIDAHDIYKEKKKTKVKK